ncbi:MAG: hypothetical protein Kow00117_01260 [Phototrophicales bacterium]
MRVMLLGMIILLLAACGGSSEPDPTALPTNPPTIQATLVPTLTFTPVPTLQPDDFSFEIATVQAAVSPEETEIPMQFVVAPNPEDQMEAPIELTAPEGWEVGHLSAPVQDLIGYRVIPVSIYRGPVPGGTGYIVVLWGFYNIGRAGNPLLGEENIIDPWLDALRLLRLVLIEPECRYGTGERKDNLRVGNVLGSGADWSAVDCPTTADTRGWFVATNVDGINFAFYIYAEPIEAMDIPQTPEVLQSILDSIEFKVTEFITSMERPEVTEEP